MGSIIRCPGVFCVGRLFLRKGNERSAWLKRGQPYLSTWAFISVIKTWDQSWSPVASFRSSLRFASRLHGSGQGWAPREVPRLYLCRQRTPSSGHPPPAPAALPPPSWKEGPEARRPERVGAVARPWGGAALAATETAAAVRGAAVCRAWCVCVCLRVCGAGSHVAVEAPSPAGAPRRPGLRERWGGVGATERPCRCSGRQRCPALSPWGGGRALPLARSRGSRAARPSSPGREPGGGLAGRVSYIDGGNSALPLQAFIFPSFFPFYWLEKYSWAFCPPSALETDWFIIRGECIILGPVGPLGARWSLKGVSALGELGWSAASILGKKAESRQSPGIG